MAVASVSEIWDGRQGGQKLPGRVRDYTRVFEVVTDSASDGPVVALGAGAVALGLPLFGASYPDDIGAIALEISPRQHSDDPRRWLVDVRYSSEFGAGSEGGESAAQPSETAGGDGGEEPPEELPENPILRPPVWKITFQQNREPVGKAARVWYDAETDVVSDIDEEPTAVRNSANLPFDPPAEIEVSRPVISVTVNRSASQYRLADVVSLQDAVNFEEWYGLPPRCGRCIGVEVGSKYENGIAYVEMTYQIAINYKTWDLRILDAGYYTKEGSTPPKWVKIVDDTGREPSQPVPLNGAGAKLDPDADPVFLRWSAYRAVPFSTLILA